MADHTEAIQLAPVEAGPSLMQIADRVLGRPLLIHPTKAEVIMHVLEGRLPMGGAGLAPLGPDASRFVGTSIGKDGRYRTYRTDGSVAMISVIGSLVNRGAWIGANSGLTSYEGIAKQLSDAAADPAVKSIVLDLDSPGGEATGMFALAAKVREVAAEKRVVAVVNDMAASAAYGIASQASEIVVSPTSMVGSIGVVLTHLDRSGELAAKGVKPTLIFAGRHKVDGNPYGPLSEGVRADLQAEVAKFYDQFVGLVAQGRGDRLTEAEARATEARVFIGQEAIDRGLADRMASFDAVLASLQSSTTKPGRAPAKQKEGQAMTDTTTTPAAGITQEAHNAAVAAARAEGHAAGLAEGRKAGATEAKERVGAILNAEEAKGRETLASHIAFKTDMSADDAKAMLAASPLGGAAPAANLQERQRAAGEFGPSAGAPTGTSAPAQDVWKQAVAGTGGAFYG